MNAALLAATAAAGVALLVLPERAKRPDPDGRGARARLLDRADDRVRRWLRQAGGPNVTPVQLVTSSVAAAILAAAAASSLLGTGVPSFLLGVLAAFVPAAVWRRRRLSRRRVTSDAWPRLIEELRVLIGPGGRPIPLALLEVGRRGPVEVRPAFAAAQREWSMSSDPDRMIQVLRRELADPVADAVCETLLVAIAAGGDVDHRLAALADDRRRDARERNEAHAKQAGARLARWFVVAVPAGMAVAGLNVGDGAAAYRTPTGQVLVVAAIAIVVLCWWWATRILRLPEPRRVLGR